MIYWVLVVLVFVLAAGWLLLLVVSRRQLLSEGERMRVREMWGNVELLMADAGEASWAKAVFEADKILDYVLTARKVPGANLGERLKRGKNLFRNVQVAWDAHKLRNQLAHEIDSRLARYEAERAIRFFKDSLQQLRAL
jgi:uncharacterized membrane protein